MKISFIISLLCAATGFAQSYPPAAGSPGSTAVFKDSEQIVAWASGIVVQRGLINRANPNATASGSNYATSGFDEYAIGYADGNTVSLGDGGNAVATFTQPIINGPGFDFAVFENGSTVYLELAFVEVSSDGVNFFRFPNHSQTQTETQIGSFGTPQAEYLNNLAGKYAGQYGTPFDISELPDNELLNKNRITHVKVIDVVGSVNPEYATYDSFGNAVNDSFPTPFASSGFDLQAIGVINQLSLGLPHYNNSAVLVYPNPAKGQLYIKAATPVNITIYDMAGRAVLAAKSRRENQPLNILHLSAGTYRVLVTGEHFTEALPLVISN
jgi:hypothetical protein